METKINAVYIRVSSEKQSSEMQIHPIVEFLKSKRITDIKIYQDDAESGAKVSRPALNMLLNDIKQGKVGTLTVYRIDRLFRSLSHLLELFTLFKEHSITFMSTTDNMDTTTDQGMLILHISGAFAEFERKLIAQRTKDGLANAVLKGSKLGAPTTIGREKKREVYMAKQHNLSFREIARRTGLSYSSVRRILSNPNLEQEVL